MSHLNVAVAFILFLCLPGTTVFGQGSIPSGIWIGNSPSKNRTVQRTYRTAAPSATNGNAAVKQTDSATKSTKPIKQGVKKQPRSDLPTLPSYD